MTELFVRQLGDMERYEPFLAKNKKGYFVKIVVSNEDERSSTKYLIHADRLEAIKRRKSKDVGKFYKITNMKNPLLIKTQRFRDVAEIELIVSAIEEMN